MDVSLHWHQTGSDHESLSLRRVLYAYARARSDQVLYIGKADRCTVRERLRGEHKSGLYDYFIDELGIRSIRAFVGEIYLPEGCRLSDQLLADMESLLIFELQPSGNIQSTRSRISRPGLRLSCYGEWPAYQRRFIDQAH